MTDNDTGHAQRDAESLMMLGGFMTVLAIPVLIGTAFADSARAMIVNVGAGTILLLIGLAFLLRGIKIRPKSS